jgi:hypothetical protein
MKRQPLLYFGAIGKGRGVEGRGSGVSGFGCQVSGFWCRGDKWRGMSVEG